MEAVGAGASVLAFITLALQSAKIISNTLSGIQGAPENVGHAASAVGMLQAALGQLSQCPLVSQGQSSRRDDLHDHVKRCSDDLAGFASKLSKIKIAGTDSQSRRLWKRVRTFVDEKELDKMVRVVTAHSSTLSLWLQSVQSTAVFDSRIQISALSQTISASAQDTQTRMNEELQAIAMKLDNTMNQSTTAHKSIDDKFSLILQAIESLKLATGTAGQDDRTANAESTWHPSSLVPINPTDESNQEDAKLMSCVHRLQALVHDERRVLDMDEVDRIIEDLQSVILAVQNTANDSSGKRLFKRISAALASAQMVSLNEEGTVVNRPPAGRILQQQHVLKEFKNASGRILIKTKTRRVGQQFNSFDDEEFVGRLVFVPNQRSGRSMFTATVWQKATWTGGFTSIPHLQVNPVLPADSPVFEHIWRGRLDGLLGMLRSGQASLRDHDENGNSLLAIAVNHFKPHICKFLLANNADVDVHLTEGGLRHHILICPLIGGYARADRNECLRQILEAGADPTDDGSADIYSNPFFVAFDVCVSYAASETLRLCLDHAHDWGLSIHSTNQFGQTPFLVACRSFEADDLKTILPLLFERGANVADVDPQGRSCLHFILLKAHEGCWLEQLDLFEKADSDAAVLISLIKRGADVLAKDELGRSLSHVVSATFDYYTPGISYLRDLWDFVLTVCGYNVFEVRGHRPRIARYNVCGTSNTIDISTMDYTPEIFRHLWKGWEHLCPYPEDLTDEAVDISQAATAFAQEEAANQAKPNPSAEAQSFRPTCKRCGNWEDYCRDPNCGFCEEERCGLCRISDHWDRISVSSDPSSSDPFSSNPSVVPSPLSGQAPDGSGDDESSDGEVAQCQYGSKADTQYLWAQPGSWNSGYETDSEGEDGSWTKAQTDASHDSTHQFPAIELENPWADVI